MDPWLSPTCHVFQPRESRPSDVGVQAIFKWDRDSKAYGAGGCSMYTVYTTYYIQVYIYIYWVAEFPGKKKATLFFVLQAPGRAKLLCFVLQQQHCLDPGLISADLKNLAWQVVDLTTEPMTSGLYIIDI